MERDKLPALKIYMCDMCGCFFACSNFTCAFHHISNLLTFYPRTAERHTKRSGNSPSKATMTSEKDRPKSGDLIALITANMQLHNLSFMHES